MEKNYTLYKDKALVREGNNICYGSMNDSAILFMLITSFKEFQNCKIPDKIFIQILSTDMSLQYHERILKQGEQSGLYDAFKTGLIWLDRYSKEVEK